MGVSPAQDIYGVPAASELAPEKGTQRAVVGPEPTVKADEEGAGWWFLQTFHTTLWSGIASLCPGQHGAQWSLSGPQASGMEGLKRG